MSRERGRPAVKSPRIQAALRQRLASGEWRAGDLIPTEHELCAQYLVSRMTLRSAMAPLETEGLLQRVRGKGTFVGGTVTPRAHLAILLDTLDLNEDQPYRDQLHRGMQAALENSGIACTVHGKPPDEPLLAYLQQHDELARSWGGVLVASGSMDATALAWLRAAGIPVVGLTRPAPELRMPWVDIDNHLGGMLAAQHLQERGCSRVLILDMAQSSFALERQRGFLHGWSEEHPPIWDDYGSFRGPEAALRVQAYCAAHLSGSAPVDGIFVYMEQPTIGVYRALAAVGLRPGHDMPVLHYNDFPWLAEVLEPAPTALRQPFDRVGYEATRLLQSLIRGEEISADRILVAPELIIRGT